MHTDDVHIVSCTAGQQHSIDILVKGHVDKRLHRLDREMMWCDMTVLMMPDSIPVVAHQRSHESIHRFFPMVLFLHLYDTVDAAAPLPELVVVQAPMNM